MSKPAFQIDDIVLVDNKEILITGVIRRNYVLYYIIEYEVDEPIEPIESKIEFVPEFPYVVPVSVLDAYGKRKM